MGLSKKKKKEECFIVTFRFTLFRNKLWTSLLVCFILFQRFSSISYLFHLLRNRNGLIKKNAWLRKVSVSLLHYVTPCFVTSTDQGVWTVSSCFVTNETHETDHQWELLLVCFICFILFQSILEYSLYILIVSSVSVTEKKTCPKKTCVVFMQYLPWQPCFWRIQMAQTILVEDHQRNISAKLYWSWSSGFWQEDF